MVQEHGPIGSFYFGQKDIQNNGNFDFLSPVLSGVDPLEKEKLHQEFKDLSGTTNGERSRRALASLLCSSSSKKFKTELDRLRISQAEAYQFLETPPITKLTNIMLKDPEKYSYQLGILMPVLGNAKDMLAKNSLHFKEDKSNLKVVPVNREWDFVRPPKKGCLMH